MKNDNFFDNPADFDMDFDNFPDEDLPLGDEPGADCGQDSDYSDDIFHDDELFGESGGHRNRLRSLLSLSRLDEVKPLHALEFMLGCMLPRQDVQPVARRVMDFFDGDLHRLLRADLQQFMQIPGLGSSGARWLDLICRNARLFKECDLPMPVVLNNYRRLRRYCRYLMACFGKPCCLQLLTDEKDHLLMCLPLAHGEKWNHREIILNAADMASSTHAANAYIVVFVKSVYRHPNRSDLQALDLYLKVMQHTLCTPRDLLFVDRFHCCSLHAMRKMPQTRTPRRWVEEDFVNPPGENLILHRYDENGHHPVHIPIFQLEVEERHESV